MAVSIGMSQSIEYCLVPAAETGVVPMSRSPASLDTSFSQTYDVTIGTIGNSIDFGDFPRFFFKVIKNPDEKIK